MKWPCRSQADDVVQSAQARLCMQPPECLRSQVNIGGWLVGWLQAGKGCLLGLFVDGGPRNRLKPARVASLLSSRGPPYYLS